MKQIALFFLGGALFGSAAFAQTPTPIVPTPASVAASSQAIIIELPAGGNIAQGDLLYVDTNNTAKLADADGASATVADVKCLSLTSASSGQRVRCVAYDPALTIAQTVAAGELYVLSGVAGRMSTAASIVSGNYATVVGIGISTSKIFFNPISSGIAL